MEGFTPSVLMMIILAVIIGFAVGCFFMKQREKIKEAKKKLHTSEQEHEEDEDDGFITKADLQELGHRHHTSAGKGYHA